MTQNTKTPPACGNGSPGPFNDAAQKINPENNRHDLSAQFFFWSALGILALAILVRILVLLTREEFWLDEYATMWVVLSPSGIIHTLANLDTQPPLYYLLLKVWTNLFGIQEIVVRSLSTLLGMAAIGVFGFWLRELGLSRRATLWSLLLFALAGMQIQYSTEARDYMLGGLLVVLCLYCFTAALRRQSPPHWIAFGIFLLLSFYTHHLLVPMAGAYLLAAWVMRASRRSWIWLFGVLAADAILYLPGFMFVLMQLRFAYHDIDWTTRLWTQQHLIFNAIPDSMLRIGLMGSFSDVIQNEYIRSGVLAGSIVLYFLAICFVIEPTRRMFCRLFKAPVAGAAGRSTVYALLIFGFYNLVFLYLYSLLHKPMYVYGRYDFFAQPGYLAFIGLGIAQFQEVLTSKNLWLGRLAPLCLTALICIPCLANASHVFNTNDLYNQRGLVLLRYSQPGDVVVATWPDGMGLRYQQILHHIPVTIVDFPSATSRHPAWLNIADFSSPPLSQEARSIINTFNHSDSTHHLWLAYDPNAYLALPDTLFAAKLFTHAADHSGLQRWQPGTNPIPDKLCMIVWTHKP